MLSLLHIQIIIDILFFVIILFLLYQLNKKIEQGSKVVDTSAMNELKKIIHDSEDFANQFINVMEENKEQFNKLVKQMDDKEKKMVIRLKEAQDILEKLSSQKAESTPKAVHNKYDDVMEMMRHGLSLEEITKRSEMTEGEIHLIMELAKAGKNDAL